MRLIKIIGLLLGLIVLGLALFLGVSLLQDKFSATHQDNKSEILDPEIYRLPEPLYNRGLNLIFFSDGYLSLEEFNTDVEMLMGQAKNIEPWKSYTNYNIYEILPKELDVCSVKVQDERKPVLRCDPAKVNSYLNKISTNGPFKVIVLSHRDFQSWANVSRIADSGIFFSLPTAVTAPADAGAMGVLFAHMLGHAFGLKDEEMFVVAKSDSEAHNADGPNCAPDKETAKKWWGDLVGERGVGYFWGCAANEDFIKPTEGSIMNLNDLSKFVPNYGPVSELYLKKILDYCFTDNNQAPSDPDFFGTYPEFKECLK